MKLRKNGRSTGEPIQTQDVSDKPHTIGLPPHKRGDLLHAQAVYMLRRQLTVDLIAEIVFLIRQGNYRYVAAQAVGVPPSRFYQWMRKGERIVKQIDAGTWKRETIPLEAALCIKVHEAEGVCHATLLQDVLHADDPRLKFEFLKHRYSRHYKEQPTVNDSTGQEVRDPVEILAEKLLPILDRVNDAAKVEELGRVQIEAARRYERALDGEGRVVTSIEDRIAELFDEAGDEDEDADGDNEQAPTHH